MSFVPSELIDCEPKSTAAVSEAGASQLLKLLLDRELFSTRKHNDNSKDTCMLIECQQAGKPIFMTLEHLDKKIANELDLMGQLTAEEMCCRLEIVDTLNAKFIHQHAISIVCQSFQRLATRTENTEDQPRFHFVADFHKGLTLNYIKTELAPLVATFVQKSPSETVLLSQLAHDVLHLSVDTTCSLLTQFIFPTLQHGIQLCTRRNGTSIVITSNALDEMKKQLQSALLAATQPISLERLYGQLNIDCASDLLQQQSLSTTLPGHFRGGLYVPDCYVHEQRHKVLDTFRSNGFITTEQCQAIGVMTSQMKAILKEHYRDYDLSSPIENSVITLNECVVNVDVIVTPLEVVLAETIAVGSWIDLQNQLPPEILSKRDEVEFLIQSFILSRIDNENDSKELPRLGETFFSESGEALFVSQAMINNVADALLPPLIDRFAVGKAQQLDQKASTLSPSLSVTDKTRKADRKTRKGQLHESNDEVDIENLVPLSEIVDVVVAAYPELEIYATTATNSSLPHSKNRDKQRSILACLCKKMFYTETFRNACAAAVQVECSRLASDRASKFRITHKDAAHKVQTVEVAFEDSSCFAAACYMIQGMAEFIEYAESEHGETIEQDVLVMIKNDFLKSSCAAFTARVTQYCLFKFEVKEGTFSFESSNNISVPHYYSAVEVAKRQYSQPYLSCIGLDKVGNIRDPLQGLRDLLPNNAGVALARQWKLCGNGSYQILSEHQTTKIGDYPGFLSHVEQHTLSICGLPFKKLDKKSKKNLLYSRRQQMIRQLCDETDPVAVLEFAVMILYQFAKNKIVFGSHLRGPVLKMLSKERKISNETSAALFNLNRALESNEEVDSQLLEQVKGYACGRENNNL